MRKKILSILFLFCFIGNQTEIQANEITIGIALGFTGPTESIVPSMASSAELAVSEANSSKIFLNGEEKVNSIKIDTKCDTSNIKFIDRVQAVLNFEKTHPPSNMAPDNPRACAPQPQDWGPSGWSVCVANPPKGRSTVWDPTLFWLRSSRVSWLVLVTAVASSHSSRYHSPPPLRGGGDHNSPAGNLNYLSSHMYRKKYSSCFFLFL